MKLNSKFWSVLLLFPVVVMGQGIVPPSSGGNSEDLTEHIEDIEDAHDASAISIVDEDELFEAENVELALAEVSGHVTSVASSVHQITFDPPDPQVGDVITLDGGIFNISGYAAVGVDSLVIKTIPITGGEGEIALLTGALKKQISDNEIWLETDVDGRFSFTVTNTQAEATLVVITINYGVTVLYKITFI